MAAHPPITVLMTVYNAEPYLAQAIESALAQTWRDFELLTVIDDGSTDSSGSILASFAARDPRIRVLRIAGQGRIPALNHGLQEARGRHVAILDADDVAVPDRLEKQMRFLADHPRVGVLGGAVRYINSAGRPGRVARMPITHQCIAAAMATGGCMMNSTAIALRSAMLEAGAYRDTVPAGEDYDLWLRMIDRVEFANLPDVLVDYRVHAGQLSQTKLRVLGQATLIARASLAGQRRDGEDPVAHLPEFCPEVLTILGITDEQIAAASAWINLGRARILLDAGYIREGLETVDQTPLQDLPTALWAEILVQSRSSPWSSGRAEGRYGRALAAFTAAALNMRAVGAIGGRVLAGVAKRLGRQRR